MTKKINKNWTKVATPTHPLIDAINKAMLVSACEIDQDYSAEWALEGGDVEANTVRLLNAVLAVSTRYSFIFDISKSEQEVSVKVFLDNVYDKGDSNG